jgi:hypothetical protein
MQSLPVAMALCFSLSGSAGRSAIMSNARWNAGLQRPDGGDPKRRMASKQRQRATDAIGRSQARLDELAYGLLVPIADMFAKLKRYKDEHGHCNVGRADGTANWPCGDPPACV